MAERDVPHSSRQSAGSVSDGEWSPVGDSRTHKFGILAESSLDYPLGVNVRSRNFENNTLEERILIFRDDLNRDVESFYTSSVACCAACYGSFAKEWPGTVARDIELDRGGIDIASFLAMSRIRDDFDPEAIETLAKYLECPNCGAVLDGSFWIYEHPFTVPETFDIEEISAIADKYPFLLLSHEFARKVFDTIAALAKDATPQKLPKPVFRARLLPPSHPSALEDFGPPPSAKVAEGRFNHAGHSMLYLADNERTALAEMGARTGPVHIATVELDLDLKILDLSVSGDVEGEVQEIIQCVARSALCAAPRISEGWDRPEYVFSRFVADCARHAGFGAIRYGSVRDHAGANLVLLEPPSDMLKATLVGIKLMSD